MSALTLENYSLLLSTLCALLKRLFLDGIGILDGKTVEQHWV